MRYCARCVYPENAKPYIIFDDQGICSGCRVKEKEALIDWGKRKVAFEKIIEKAKKNSFDSKAHYDCIIPVSGGKDSHYQAHIIKNVYKLNPLFVTYNHLFNAPLGLRNLENLFLKFESDLIRFSSNISTVKKLSKLMLKECGDITWHYHCGILTFPIQEAVKSKIPLIIWAENNFSNLVGTFDPDDMVEFSERARTDLGLRGIDIRDYVDNPECNLKWSEISPFLYPKIEDIEKVGVRGIYLSNYFYWDEVKVAAEMVEKYDFQPNSSFRERTFNKYAKLDDIHSNGVHDYLKYLKYGYGRATDDASTLVRLGYISREKAIELVKLYDHKEPSDLKTYLDFVGIDKKTFFQYVDKFRDQEIWKKTSDGFEKITNISESNLNADMIENARLPKNNRFIDPFSISGKYDFLDEKALSDFYNGYKYL